MVRILARLLPRLAAEPGHDRRITCACATTTKEELAFYSKATTDFEYLFPFGWGELWGVADRTDYDLKQHQEHSGQPMEYIDPVTNERYLPYCH